MKRELSRNDEIELEAFRQISEHYRQDVRLFWTGSNFYTLIHGGLLSVFTVIKNPFFQLVLGVFGFFSAVFWYKSSTGVIFFMDKWRQTMITANNKLQNGRGWYSKGAEIVIQNKSKIPAVVTRKLPIIVGILWIAVILYIVIDYLRVQYCLFI